MKILHINASYKPAYIYGGPSFSIPLLSEALAKQGKQVEVYTTSANGTKELPLLKNTPQQVNGVQVTYFKRLTKDPFHFTPSLYVQLWKTARSFDLIHIHSWWNTIAILSCVIALLRGTPVILSPRGTLSCYSFNNKHKLIKQLFHTLFGKFLLNCCHIHTTSRAEQLRIGDLLKPLGIFSIYNLVHLPEQISRPDHPPEPLRLLFLSRIEPKKGLELLFSTLAGLRIPFLLSIAGDGQVAYIARLKTLARQYKIDASIQWLGFAGKDKFELMAQHQVLVLPSSDENFGNVVIESLSVGTAVLVSNKVGLASYVRNNNFGWICRLYKNSVKACLENIHQNQAVLHQIRKAAPAQIAIDFNTDKLSQQYVDHYEQVLLHHRLNS